MSGTDHIVGGRAMKSSGFFLHSVRAVRMDGAGGGQSRVVGAGPCTQLWQYCGSAYCGFGFTVGVGDVLF